MLLIMILWDTCYCLNLILEYTRWLSRNHRLESGCEIGQHAKLKVIYCIKILPAIQYYLWTQSGWFNCERGQWDLFSSYFESL